MSNKFRKEAVLYAFNPETQYTCGQCFNRQPGTNICSLFGPNDPISPEYGSCGFYAHEDGEKSGIFAPIVGVITKLQSGYAENNTGFSCKRCEYFVVGKNDCKAVDKDSEGLTPGIIHPNACCNNWDADKVRANMDTEELLHVISADKAPVRLRPYFADPHPDLYSPYSTELTNGSKSWIGVDFDGVLARTMDPYKEGEVGAPVWAMVNRVKRWLRQGKKVKILTARASSAQDISAIAYFLHKVGLPNLEITNVKNHGLVALYDDKATAVERNTGKLLSPEIFSALKLFSAEAPTIMEGESHASVIIVFGGTKIALVGRDGEEKFMLPAGHVDKGETAIEAAARELREETGIDLSLDQLLFVGIMPRRDKGENNSFFTAQIEDPPEVKAGSDVDTAFWNDVWTLPKLKFDPSEALIKARMVLDSPPSARGLLIAFEGVDGSGKSTQATYLANYLEEMGIAYTVTRWNSSEHISEAISEMKRQKSLSPALFFLLHAADMIMRYESEVIPALMRNEVVLCDRYFYTGLVRDAIRGINIDYNRELYKNLRSPDLLFYCNVDPGQAVNRLSKDKFGFYNTGMDVGGFGEDRESSALGYEREMHRLYGEILPKETIQLDAAHKPENVAQQVLDKVGSAIIERYQIAPIS